MTKKALIYNPYWATLGGGERYVATLAKSLLNWGWQVDIFWHHDITTELNSRFNINLKGANFVKQDWTYHYDLVFWVSDGSLPTSLAKKTIIHFQFPFRLKTGFLDYLKSRNYIFVCNSNFTKRFIDESFSSNSLVLYPPIDTNLFKPAKKTNSIIYVGRFSSLTQNKNQLLLIKSFQKLHKKLPGWKLVIAGGLGVGHDERHIDSLKKEAKSLPVEIVFNPDIKDLRKIYGQAKIFWGAAGFGASEYNEPTKVEHFGISVVEAMSAGCVPIICNIGGYKEILDFKSGFLWDSLNELEQITTKIIKNPKVLKFMSIQAQNRSKMFDIACFQSSLASILG